MKGVRVLSPSDDGVVWQLPRPPVRPQTQKYVVQLLIVGNDHSPFHRGNMMGKKCTVTSHHAKCASFLPLILGTQ